MKRIKFRSTMSSNLQDFETFDVEENVGDLENALRSRIADGEELILKMVEVNHIRGAHKLVKRINQEVSFLKKVLRQKRVKKEHVKCSNLSHLDALVTCVLELQDDCAAVLEVFELHSVISESKRVCADIVSNGGCTWVKVIARNPKALTLLSAGDGDYGQRTVMDQAREFLECACQHPYHFKPPKVAFVFASGIEVPLANTLEKMGIEVRGERIVKGDCDSGTESSDPCEEEEEENLLDFGNRLSQNISEQFCSQNDGPFREIHNNAIGNISRTEEKEMQDRLNLDVTSMIAYVSALTNGRCNSYFKEPLLRQQAEWERQKPAKAILDTLFQGRKLFCCSTAHRDFQKIIATLGGPSEKRRAEELIERVTVVPDQVSERTKQYLIEGGKVKPRSRIIFGTGDQLKAVTVTANEGFVRAAKSQGVTFAVFIHESRALTESKEMDEMKTDEELPPSSS